MGFFRILIMEVILVNITIENLEFPYELKQKIKRKVNMSNLELKFISGNLIKVNKTNLTITEPHKIIVKNSNSLLIVYIYDNEDKIYLPYNGVSISITKFISILNYMNKN